jgi:iron complex transport system substrate-binding protein
LTSGNTIDTKDWGKSLKQNMMGGFFMPKKAVSFLLGVLLCFFLTGGFLLSGCNQETKQSEDPKTPTDLKQADSGNTVFPLQLTDFLDRTVTIEKEPKRIVSLSPGTTEILFALGVGDRLVGVTSYDDYPPEKIQEIPKVGDFQGPNIEAILAQKPELIFASRLSGKEQMEALQQAGFNVVILEAASLEQIYDSIALTAQITNTTAKGEKMITEMQEQITALQKKVQALPRVKVFYLVDTNGTWTAGRNTFIDKLISLAGGENIAGAIDGWAQFSLENLPEKNPAVIITAPHAGSIEELRRLPGYVETDAVKQNRLYVLSDDNIISRPSYRIVQGLEEVASFIHPEAF